MMQLSPPPADLAILPNWVVWAPVYAADQVKPRKVPHYVSGTPRYGNQGTDEDRAQLVPYDNALRVFQESGGRYAGVGFALQPDSKIVALDFDHCVDVQGNIDPRVEKLCEGTYTEFSPSGTGVRAFFKGTLMSRKDIDAKHGAIPIEVFGHNGFVTFTGRVTDTCSLFGWDTEVAWLTPAVLEMYRERGWDTTQTPSSGPDNVLAMLEPTLELSDGEIAEYLSKLDPNMGYHEWLHVGMGVHHETKGKGFDLWHRWSMSAGNYTGADNCRERWVSFGKYHGGRITTFKSIIKQAKEADARRALSARDEAITRIAACNDEVDLRMRLCPEIARSSLFDHVARAALAEALKKKLKDLGAPVKLDDCRKLVAPMRDHVLNLDNCERPEWMRGWVYITSDDKFYNCGDGLQMTHTAFNAAYNRHMPRGDGPAKPVLKSAAATALEDYGLTCVARAMYLPWANSEGEGTFEHEGNLYVNTYRAASVPEAASEITSEAGEAISVFEQHIHLTCGERAFETG